MTEQCWHRGDPVVRGNEVGFVVADMADRDAYLVVRWQHSGIESIHLDELNLIRPFTEAEKESARTAARCTPLESLEKLEALERIEARLAERTRSIRSRREQRLVDDLIGRGFTDHPACEWDRRNANVLCVLALEPNSVGWTFKLRELLHRPIHRVFHRR